MGSVFDEIFELTPIVALDSSHPEPVHIMPQVAAPSETVVLESPPRGGVLPALPGLELEPAAPWTEFIIFRKMEAKAVAIIHAKGGTLCTLPSKEGREKVAVVMCSKGHRWRVAMARLIHRGEWCPTCRLNSREAVVQLWARRTGVTPQGPHVGTRETRSWVCPAGHRFDATFTALRNRKNGNYCLRCRSTR
jgi:hypothetical protein